MPRDTAKIKLMAAHRQWGASLVELILSITIVSIALVGLMLAIPMTTGHGGDPMVRQQAIAIAEAYMEEILLQPYDEWVASGSADVGGPEAGETRATYDDINDYDAITNAKVQYRGSGELEELLNYRVSVTVDDSYDSLGPATQTIAGNDAKQVTVTVTHDSGDSVVLRAYRTRY